MVRFDNSVNSLHELVSCSAKIDPPRVPFLTQENYDAAQAATAPPPPFTLTEVLMSTSTTGHPTIGGIRIDEMFSECFQQDNQLGDGRYVYVESDFAKANHAECLGAAQIVLDYRSAQSIDFEEWQVSAVPFVMAFVMLYFGYRIGLMR